MKEMKYLILLSTLTFITLGPTAWSQDLWDQQQLQWFELDQQRVAFQLPRSWEVIKNPQDIPLILFGPKTNGGRIMISVLPFNAQNLEFDTEKIEQNQSLYQQGRERWLTEVHGHSLKYFPYQVTSWPHAQKVQSIGFSYHISNVSYSEHSFYVHCNDFLFHLKVLYRHNPFKSDREKILQLMESFQCENHAPRGAD